MRYKPSSVPPRRRVTGEAGKAIYLDPTLPPGSPPTRAPAEAAYPRRCLPEGGRPEPRHVAAWPCARWGLPCQAGHPARGALLPHHFTLTLRLAKGGIFSVALSRSQSARRIGPSRTVGVTHHRGSEALGLSSPRPHRARSGLPRIRPIALYRGHAGSGQKSPQITRITWMGKRSGRVRPRTRLRRANFTNWNATRYGSLSSPNPCNPCNPCNPWTLTPASCPRPGGWGFLSAARSGRLVAPGEAA